jgi:hypothetical protein
MIDGIDLDEMDLGELPELERRDDGSVDTVDDEMDLGGMPELEHRDDQSEFEFEGEEDDEGEFYDSNSEEEEQFYDCNGGDYCFYVEGEWFNKDDMDLMDDDDWLDFEDWYFLNGGTANGCGFV